MLKEVNFKARWKWLGFNSKLYSNVFSTKWQKLQFDLFSRSEIDPASDYVSRPTPSQYLSIKLSQATFTNTKKFSTVSPDIEALK